MSQKRERFIRKNDKYGRVNISLFTFSSIDCTLDLSHIVCEQICYL